MNIIKRFYKLLEGIKIILEIGVFNNFNYLYKFNGFVAVVVTGNFLMGYLITKANVARAREKIGQAKLVEPFRI